MLRISLPRKGDKKEKRQSFPFGNRKASIRSRCRSTLSESSEDTDSRITHRLSRLFGGHSERSFSDVSNSTRTSTSDESYRTHHGHIKRLIQSEDSVPPHMIPPYSPTGAWNGKFPYSNFYVRLPDGKWMIRYRSGDRDILGTDVFESYMI
ncbi:unnamed protein product [Umbelopsis sp. WA50703]|jgi:hypothetical protein